jgi:NAD(P)-dependent dehydrogenase (short-subunit alcohol dehydrogenase family)
MHLDMTSSPSIKSFVQKVSTDFDRIDGFVCNAGVMIDQWADVEGMESSMAINVVNTLQLGILLMPKLSAVAKKHGIHPTLVFIVSVLGYTAKTELDKSRKGNIFDGFNNQQRANMDQR